MPINKNKFYMQITDTHTLMRKKKQTNKQLKPTRPASVSMSRVPTSFVSWVKIKTMINKKPEKTTIKRKKIQTKSKKIIKKKTKKCGTVVVVLAALALGSKYDKVAWFPNWRSICCIRRPTGISFFSLSVVGVFYLVF